MSVLDASVVIKWFICERDSDKALTLRDRYYQENFEIIVPDLILYEIGNALRFHPDISTDDVKDALNSLFDMGIEIVTPTRNLLERATDLTLSHSITFYDALYLALAFEINDILITADEKFVSKLNGSARKHVVLLNKV